MASKETVREAVERGYNVEVAGCNCPAHEAGTTTIIPPLAGVTYKATNTEYGVYCEACMSALARGIEPSVGTPKGGQNALSGESKTEVAGGELVRFIFTTTKDSIAIVASASGYGVKKVGKTWTLTTPWEANLCGLTRQWRAWHIPHNSKVTVLVTKGVGIEPHAKSETVIAKAMDEAKRLRPYKAYRRAR